MRYLVWRYKIQSQHFYLGILSFKLLTPAWNMIVRKLDLRWFILHDIDSHNNQYGYITRDIKRGVLLHWDVI